MVPTNGPREKEFRVVVIALAVAPFLSVKNATGTLTTIMSYNTISKYIYHEISSVMSVANNDSSHTPMSNNISKVDAARAVITTVVTTTFTPAQFASEDLNGRVNYYSIKRANTTGF